MSDLFDDAVDCVEREERAKRMSEVYQHPIPLTPPKVEPTDTVQFTRGWLPKRRERTDMEQVTDGLRYSTAEATFVLEGTRKSCYRDRVALYRGVNGRYFAVNSGGIGFWMRGGPRLDCKLQRIPGYLRWRYIDPYIWMPGPKSEIDAFAWAVANLTSEDVVRIFPEKIEMA